MQNRFGKGFGGSPKASEIKKSLIGDSFAKEADQPTVLGSAVVWVGNLSEA